MQVHEGHGQFGVHEVEAGDVGRRSIAHGIGGNPLSGFFVGLPDVDGRDTAGKLVDVVRGEFAIRRRSVSETSNQINPRCFSRNACLTASIKTQSSKGKHPTCLLPPRRGDRQHGWTALRISILAGK